MQFARAPLDARPTSTAARLDAGRTMPLTAEQKRLKRARDRELADAGEPAAKKRREDEARRLQDLRAKATEERDTKNAKRKLDRPI